MTDHQPDRERSPETEGSDAATARAPDRRAEPSSAIPWRLGLFLLLATAVVIFAVQNTQEVMLEFLGWTWSLPLVIVILITMVVSIILDEAMGGVIKRRRLRQRREKEELSRLRQHGRRGSGGRPLDEPRGSGGRPLDEPRGSGGRPLDEPRGSGGRPPEE